MVSDLLFDLFVWGILNVFTIIIVHLTNMFKLSFLSFYYYCYKILCIYGCGFRLIWGLNPWGVQSKQPIKWIKYVWWRISQQIWMQHFFLNNETKFKKLTAKTVFCVIGCSVLLEWYLSQVLVQVWVGFYYNNLVIYLIC